MLRKWNVDTKVCYIIGDPMNHSCVAYMTSKMYEYLRLNAVCLQATVPAENLPEFVQAAKVLRLAGFILTTPHKQAIIPLLDDCDEMSRVFRCVNHVKIENGRLYGIGTDGIGMTRALERAGCDLAGKYVLILGAGAVAGPISAELLKRGAAGIVFANRSEERARGLIATLKQYFTHANLSCGGLNQSFLDASAKCADIVIQCTSLGLAGHDEYAPELLTFMNSLPDHCAAADVIYPDSAFLRAARARGLRHIIDGMWMALSQQPDVMRLFYGVEAGEDCLMDAEENFKIAITMRELRKARLERTSL